MIIERAEAINNRRNILVMLLVFLFAELLVNPLGEFPLNDDWSYTVSAEHLYDKGEVRIGAWPAMTLWTHLQWGAVFLRIFGMSFFVLRLSTLVSSFIGMILLYNIISKRVNPVTAMISALLIFFNPLYFSLSNTYMTDVNFLTLMITACHFALRFHESGKLLYFLGVFICSALLVLIRQFGIIVPVAFTAALLFRRHSRVLYFAAGAALSAGVYFLLYLYEGHLRATLPPDAQYKFMGEVPVDMTAVMNALGSRSGVIMVHLLVYLSPLTAAFLPGLVRSVRWYKSAAISLFSLGMAFWLTTSSPFPPGNILVNCHLGTETFYEHLNYQDGAINSHTASAEAASVMMLTAVLLCFVSLWTLLQFLLIHGRRLAGILRSGLLFPAILLAMYMVVLLVPVSYFDRYNIPAILLLVIVVSYAGRVVRPVMLPSLVVIAIFMFVSVAGTHDYMSMNRVRWDAFNHLVRDKDIDFRQVNAGFEPACYTARSWSNFLTIDDKQYVVQYRPEKGFARMKAYPFTRWLSFRHDTVWIYKRTGSE